MVLDDRTDPTIHMNGRAYDYNLGRFLSVDPFIGEPGNSQSMNPYSYLQNNPLSGRDPSGYVACDESGQNCDIGKLKVDDIENVQQMEDGSTVVNTTDGSSFRVDKVTVQSNGFQLSASFKGNNTFDLSIEKIGDESSKIDFELSFQGNEAAENSNIIMGMLTGPGETVNQAFYGETDMERFEGRANLMAMAFTMGMSGMTPSSKRRTGKGFKALPSKGAKYKVSVQFFRKSTNIPPKGRKFNQLTKRGWSQDSVDGVVNMPFTTRETINKATGNSATVYYRRDGHYIVRDDVSGDLVQMSDTRVKIGTGPGQWAPDSSIKDPYIP